MLGKISSILILIKFVLVDQHRVRGVSLGLAEDLIADFSNRAMLLLFILLIELYDGKHLRNILTPFETLL